LQPHRVSVAIATYNRAAMVNQAIEAALAQNYPPDEIVVSDDASTDGTARVLGEWSGRDPRVRIFRREENSGGVENWNYAIAQTSGEFIAWCSDDDRFLPEHLNQSLAYLDAHPEVGLVHSSFIDALETETADERLPRPLRRAAPLIVDRGGMFRYLTRYYDWPFHPSTIVMRRAVWEGTGEFDPTFALADTDWFVRAMERYPAALLPAHGVLNRRHPGNWSNRLGSARMQREIFEIVEQAIERRWPSRHPRKILWRAIWRANVRARLALTLWARLRSGHSEASLAAWYGFSRDTGRRLPGWLECAGAMAIRQFLRKRPAKFVDVRQSVSPL